MKKRMTAVIAGDGTLRCVKEEIPELKEHEVLVKVHASLISPGTEMAAAKKRRENPDEKAEAIRFGYSNAGEIIKVRGDVKGLKVGMRVAAWERAWLCIRTMRAFRSISWCRSRTA